MSQIEIIIGENQKDLLEAMFEGFKKSAEDTSILRLDTTIESLSVEMNSKVSRYNNITNSQYEWFKKNSQSETYKTEVLNKTLPATR